MNRGVDLCVSITVTIVKRAHLNKCPYMNGVALSHIQFHVKVKFCSQKMLFRHPNRCPLNTGLTVMSFRTHLYNK